VSPPSRETLSRLYEGEYFEARGMTNQRFVHAVRAMKRGTFCGYFERLRAVCPDAAAAGLRLLDVGCAVGFLPEMAAELGYEAYGVEVSPFAARLANERVPGRVFAGNLEAAAYGDGFFDVLTATDVLEHVPEPDAFLDEVVRIVRPGGVVLFAMPDATSLSARLLGRRWANVKPEHLWYFTPAQAAGLLRRHGLRVVYTGPATKRATLEYAHLQFEANPRPVATTALKAVRLLPRGLRQWPFPVRVGDMLVIARKQSD
jgi:SAM-dependent methyltransferase